jgi:hypothetical protein
MIGDVRFSGERYGDDLHRLIVVKRLEDELVKVFDVDGHATGSSLAGDGLSGMFGQGVSWRTKVLPNASSAERTKGIGGTSWGQLREWRLLTSGRAAGEGK